MAQGKTIQDQLAKAGVTCSVRQIRRTRAFSATFSAPDYNGHTAPAEEWATKIQAIIPTAKIIDSSNVHAPWRGADYILMANVQFMVLDNQEKLTMPRMNVVHGAGKRTSATRPAARHIDDGTGKPLCQHKTKTGRGIGSGYVRDFDEPTCKRCLKLAAQPAVSEPKPPAASTSFIPAYYVNEMVEWHNAFGWDIAKVIDIAESMLPTPYCIQCGDTSRWVTAEDIRPRRRKIIIHL